MICMLRDLCGILVKYDVLKTGIKIKDTYEKKQLERNSQSKINC